MEPFIDSHRGTSLFKLDNIAGNREVQINLTWIIEVYGVETSVRQQSIRQEKSHINEAYTHSTPQLPSDDPRITNQAQAIFGRERNPYLRARRIYEWMLAQFIINQEYTDGDMFDALENKQADPYTAALLYCTLLRSADIPSLPVSGVLVSRDRQTMNHWWAEFWIDGFGWIPVDVAMGAEAVPPQFSAHPDRARYYFGNIDSMRIAFSRGFTNLSPMDPRGRTVTHSRSYALQNLWEEVVSGIDSYSSLWGSIIVTGMYAQ
jgi:transglutaminase-like putative cysteine protease